MSARFNVMDSMEKRVRSRFSHRRDIILELPAEDFDCPDSGPIALLGSFLSLPVSCSGPLQSCLMHLIPDCNENEYRQRTFMKHTTKSMSAISAGDVLTCIRTCTG